jgi:hypothetical protein
MSMDESMFSIDAPLDESTRVAHSVVEDEAARI